MRIALPKVISIRKAERPRYGVLYYAKVQSRSDRRRHHIVAVGKRSAVCGCETGIYRRTSKNRCDHVKAVRARLARRAA